MSAQQKLRELVALRLQLEVASTEPLLDRFLHDRATELGFISESAYVLELAQLPLTDPEWAEVIAAVTNQLTYFYRDSEQLDALLQVLAEMASASPSTPLQIWSAGCSTGEEPYTIAMMCQRAGIAAEIWGTDINPIALATARSAVYPAWSLRHAPQAVATECFIARGSSYEVAPAIRARVKLQQHNLRTRAAWFPPERSVGWDAILCRNVLIYYPPEACRDIVATLVDSLQPDGALLIGSSESLREHHLPVTAEWVDGRVVYRRRPARGRVAPATPSHPVAPRVELPPVASYRPLDRPSITPADFPVGYSEHQSELVALLTEDRVQEGLSLIERICREHREDVVAHLSHAHLLTTLCELPRALAAYDAVETLDPLLPELWLGRGVAHRLSGDFEAALRSMQRAVFLEPRLWAASKHLAYLAQRLGRTQLALREHQRALTLASSAVGDLALVTHPIVHGPLLPRAFEDRE